MNSTDIVVINYMTCVLKRKLSEEGISYGKSHRN